MKVTTIYTIPPQASLECARLVWTIGPGGLPYIIKNRTGPAKTAVSPQLLQTYIFKPF